MKASTLRPGLLVAFKTSLAGNVQYSKSTIEEDHVTAEGTKEAEWNTRRVITDPAEFEAAAKVRNTARGMIRGVCAASAFGYLCPEEKIELLEKTIADARAAAENFNATAKLTRVQVYVLLGRVAPDDVEAVRAINSEVRELLSTMEEGIKNLDVASIREAAQKAKSIGQMLSKDAQERVEEAVKAARAVATKINKAGEQAAQEVDRATIAKITEARTAFLDLDGGPIEIQDPSAQSRAVDLDPNQSADIDGRYPHVRQLDWEPSR